MDIAAILALISTGEQILGPIIVAIRNKAGGTSVVMILDSADANFSANQKQINDWLVSKGKPPIQS